MGRGARTNTSGHAALTSVAALSRDDLWRRGEGEPAWADTLNPVVAARAELAAQAAIENPILPPEHQILSVRREPGARLEKAYCEGAYNDRGRALANARGIAEMTHADWGEGEFEPVAVYLVELTDTEAIVCDLDGAELHRRARSA